MHWKTLHKTAKKKKDTQFYIIVKELTNGSETAGKD